MTVRCSVRNGKGNRRSRHPHYYLLFYIFYDMFSLLTPETSRNTSLMPGGVLSLSHMQVNSSSAFIGNNQEMCPNKNTGPHHHAGLASGRESSHIILPHLNL